MARKVKETLKYICILIIVSIPVLIIIRTTNWQSSIITRMIKTREGYSMNDIDDDEGDEDGEGDEGDEGDDELGGKMSSTNKLSSMPINSSKCDSSTDNLTRGKIRNIVKLRKSYENSGGTVKDDLYTKYYTAWYDADADEWENENVDKKNTELNTICKLMNFEAAEMKIRSS
jgi:hypothetical protein